MSDILVAAFLIWTSLFLSATLVFPGNLSAARAFQPAARLARSALVEAAETARYFTGPDTQGHGIAPTTLLRLQVSAAALGALGGLWVATVVPVPSGRWLLPLIGGVSAYQIPALLMGRRLVARRRAVLRELPEVVSLLRALPHSNLAMALAAIVRTRRGLLATAIRDALERNATGVPLLKALGEATTALRIEELGRFVELLSQVQATSARSGELLRVSEQELLSRRRERALRAVETAEGKISAVLTVTTAVQLLLLLVVPSLLKFFPPEGL